MKKHKLDKLFSDKLNDYQRQPSTAGWERLEESLEQRPQKQLWTWISIAASAMLVAFSSWYMFADDSSVSQSNYTYSDSQVNEVDVPYEIVLVPVFIQVPIDHSTTEAQLADNKVPEIKSERNEYILPKNISNTSVTLANNSPNAHQLVPARQLPEVIDDTQSEDLRIAQASEAITENIADIHEPLTIIYKLSEPEPKSNFTKAIDYVVEVRNGDKKLVDFKKIKENIKLKLKLNKEVNSI
jgi:hypothetical protein